MNERPLHLDDGELLRLLDEQESPDEREAWERHLQSCGLCSAALQDLGRLSRNLASDMAEITVPRGFLERTGPGSAPHRRGSAGVTPWLRAAAMVSLVLLPLLTVDSLRAWISNRIGGVSYAPAPETVAAVRADRSDTPVEGGGELRFRPTGDALTVEITSRQAAGVLILRRADGADGILDIRGGGDEYSLVSERLLRIENGAHSGASYALWLPASVRRVHVQIAGEAPRQIDMDRREAAWTLSLDSDSVQ